MCYATYSEAPLRHWQIKKNTVQRSEIIINVQEYKSHKVADRMGYWFLSLEPRIF